MKKITFTLAIVFLTFFASFSSMAECLINLSAVKAPQTESVPAATENYLLTRLQNALSADGIAVDDGLSQFFIAGRFSHIMEDVLPGPPMQSALHTALTLYIGDMSSETIYASTTLDLRGVGTSSERAFINALRQLNARNQQIESFVNTARRKIISYFDSNYQQIIAQADRAAAQHNYEEALWRLNMVPECCRGYDQVRAKTNVMFKNYIDQQGVALLSQAKAIWAASHDPASASDAFAFLLQIDPESSAYPAAQNLVKEINESVKSDRQFELRQKYKDKIDMEKSRINAAREIGVAYGRGQKAQTTNIMWLR